MQKIRFYCFLLIRTSDSICIRNVSRKHFPKTKFQKYLFIIITITEYKKIKHFVIKTVGKIPKHSDRFYECGKILYTLEYLYQSAGIFLHLDYCVHVCIHIKYYAASINFCDYRKHKNNNYV